MRMNLFCEELKFFKFELNTKEKYIFYSNFESFELQEK